MFIPLVLIALVAIFSALCAHFACVRLDNSERRLRELECVVRGMLKDKGHGEATCFLLVPGDTPRSPK